ncbi:MAG TPA: M3 family metallopeptidase [Longimicrobiales bacterium]|nr:M3 family metallopeptidase [Longimicrobiales bacterium]
MHDGTAEAEATLLADWTGRCGGVPPFDAVEVGAFAPALQAAMDSYLAEIDAICEQEHAPTFHNTLEPLERAGRQYDRVAATFHVWRSNVSTPALRDVERELAPRLAAFADRIMQNEALFQRIEVVYRSPEKERLEPEQQRLLWLHYTTFVRSGARLAPDGKARLSAINQQLATLFTRFNQNVLADEEGQYLVLETASDLAGLPASQVDAAAAAAAERGLTGRWVIANTRSSMEPFLVHSTRRDLRERGWRLWTRRGDGSGEGDNKPIVSEILQLRAERAGLLGYATHAHWRLEHTMAGSPDRVLELLGAVWPAAVRRVAVEVADMEQLAREEGAELDIRPWDYRHFAERVRHRHFDMDEADLRQYLQLDSVREGMFAVAAELFGLSFTEVSDVPVFHPDVRVWEVADGAGDTVGLWYFDPFARPGKKSGAWMTAYRSQSRVNGAEATLVSNNCNYTKPAGGEPVLISWDDATTLFHEFGHALHGLLSDVTYPSLSGTAVPRDFVEFPSQLMEHWLMTDSVLKRFAIHWQTGEPIPDALVERLRRAATFNQGFETTEYLASAWVDMRMHLAGAGEIEPAAFEATVLDELGMPAALAMRHRTPHFQHAFGSDGYSAGYYSYLWADTLVADAWEAFLDAGGPFDREVADRLRAAVLSAGNTRDPAEAYRAFRGRDADTTALMRKRGLV